MLQDFGLDEAIQRDSNVPAENIWAVTFARTITAFFIQQQLLDLKKQAPLKTSTIWNVCQICGKAVFVKEALKKIIQEETFDVVSMLHQEVLIVAPKVIYISWQNFLCGFQQS